MGEGTIPDRPTEVMGLYRLATVPLGIVLLRPKSNGVCPTAIYYLVSSAINKNVIKEEPIFPPSNRFLN
jgi:hypothetical protein